MKFLIPGSVALVFGLLPCVHATINFKPQTAIENLDGVDFEVIRFPDGEPPARIAPSPDWNLISDDERRALFNATDASNARVTFESASTSIPRSVEDLKKLAQAAIPQDAVVESVEAEPAWETMSTMAWRTTVKYSTNYGEFEQRIITLPFESLRVQISLICESKIIDEKWASFVNFAGDFVFEDLGTLVPLKIIEEKP